MKALVVYYSLEGNTALIADTIRETLMIPAMRIQPVKELSSTGFRKYVWGGSQVIMGFKPKLEPIAVDFQEFDVIFLGSPIWAGTFAPPIKTLLEEGYFTNKKVYYFYTHEGDHSALQGVPKRAFLNTTDLSLLKVLFLS